jgi:hypothetical protein
MPDERYFSIPSADGNARFRAATQAKPVPQERRTIIHDGLDRHYRGLLDQPIPVLGNKSPRAAVKTAKGRTKVVDWLKTSKTTQPKWSVTMMKWLLTTSVGYGPNWGSPN